MLWFSRLNLVAVLLCYGVIVFGAFVRLSDAGLGCPDWPGCYGQLTVPDTVHEVDAAHQAYPQRPVEAHKAWKEMIHRYLASTLGALIVLLAAMSVRHRPAGVPKALPWLLVALVVFQGMLGMWTVTWQLKPLVVTGHLLGGMTTFASLLWMLLSQQRTPAAVANNAPAGLPIWALLALLVLAVQIFLGGWTSSNYAALACPDFPTCRGEFLPALDLHSAFTLWHGLGINYEFGILDSRARVTIHLFHRYSGLVVVPLVLGALALWLLLRAQAQAWRFLGGLLLGVLAVQLSIGIAVVLLHLPLSVAVLHNAGAALLLAVLVTINQRVRHSDTSWSA